jgi:hypothetical protein
LEVEEKLVELKYKGRLRESAYRLGLDSISAALVFPQLWSRFARLLAFGDRRSAKKLFFK